MHQDIYLFLSLLQLTMNTFKTDNSVAGLIHHSFAEKTHPPENNHQVCRCFISQFDDFQIILNDAQTHGVLVVGRNFKVTIVSLPQYCMDLSTGSKSLVGLLGNDCAYATPVTLFDDFAKDILSIPSTKTSMTGQLLITRTSIDIPEGLNP